MTAENLKFILVLDNVDYTTNQEPTSKRNNVFP